MPSFCNPLIGGFAEPFKHRPPRLDGTRAIRFEIQGSPSGSAIRAVRNRHDAGRLISLLNASGNRPSRMDVVEEFSSGVFHRSHCANRYRRRYDRPILEGSPAQLECRRCESNRCSMVRRFLPLVRIRTYLDEIVGRIDFLPVISSHSEDELSMVADIATETPTQFQVRAGFSAQPGKRGRKSFIAQVPLRERSQMHAGRTPSFTSRSARFNQRIAPCRD